MNTPIILSKRCFSDLLGILNFENLKNNRESYSFSIIAYLVIAVFVIIAYYPSLKNDYGFNDNYLFNEVTEKGISAAYEIMTSPYRQTENLSYGYRPIVSLSAALEVSLFGKNATVSHGINILIFIFICWLLFYLAKIIYPDVDQKYWLMGVLFFTVLSVHADVVCNIKSRDELLTCLFSLKGTVFAKRYFDHSKWYFLVLVAICFLLAAWSKTTFVFYVFLGTIILLFSQKPQLKKIIAIGLFMFLGGFIAKIIQKIVLEFPQRDLPFIQFPLKDSNIIERIPTAIYSFGKYTELLFVPNNLSFYYGYGQVPISFSQAQGHLTFYLGIVVMIILPILLWYFYKKNRIVFSGISMLFLGLLIYSNLMKPGPGLIAERFFFGPSISVIFIVAGMFFGLMKNEPERSKAFVYLGLFIVGVSFVYQFQKTFQRNYDWKNKLTLFNADIDHLQSSAKANLLLADEMMFENRMNNSKIHPFEKVHLHYDRSTKIYPDYDIAWNNLAFASLFFENPKTAKAAIDKALSLNRSSKNLSNLAIYYQQVKDDDKALKVWQEIAANNKVSLNLLESCYLRIHNILIGKSKFVEAEKYARESIKYFPQSSTYYDHLAKACFAQQKYEESFVAWKNAYKFNPKSTVIPYKLWKAYESIGMQDSATTYMKIYNRNQ